MAVMKPCSSSSRILGGIAVRLPVFLLLLLFLSPVLLKSARADSAAFQSYAERDGVASDYISGVAFGSGNAVWIATPRGATFVQGKYWITYTSAHGLGNTWVNGVAVGKDGKAYFATNGGGLSVFDGSKRKTYSTSNSGIPGNYLTTVAVDGKGRVWVGTSGAGVGRLDGDQWTKFAVGSNYVNGLVLDASGNPWVATDDGAFFFDGKNWVRLTQATGLPTNRVKAVAVAPDGKIWFATENGITAYDGRRYKTYQATDGLEDNNVQAISVDSQNRVWAGTGSGLAMFDGTTWKSYTTADGLADNLVTSLAVDARGNVWVGTPHGLSVMGTTLAKVSALPVVLVHGWHGPDSDQLEDSEFRYIAQYMEEDGIQPFYASGISPQRTLFQNAATLREVIASVKAQTGATQVDLIAFSMGGLNARAYLESTLYQNDVRRAIILGTPQAGVRLWYSFLTREIEARPNEPSAIELTPEYADLFNRTHAPRATIPYDLLVGDARSQPGLELLKAFPPSDGLISEWSAHALTGPLVRRIVDSDVHAWNPAPVALNVGSYLYPDQTYDRFIRNALRDPDVRPLGFSATPVDPVAPRNITPMEVSQIRAGDTITRSVTIDANRGARFLARWNQGDMDLKLKAPDGTRYTPTAFRDAIYLKADIADLAAYSFARAQTGTWTLEMTRLDKGTQPLTVTSYVDLDTDVRLSAATDHAWYKPGVPVIIRATLSNRARGLDVRAQIEWLGDGHSPRGAPTEIRLLEEGAPGTYAETLTNLTNGGYYLLRITARGPGLARERQLIFSVSPPGTAHFTGDYKVHVEGGEGNYSALVLDAQVDASREGSYALAATLSGPQRQLVASLTAPLTLKQGVQTASVTIPGRDLRAIGVDGPYTVDLVLMDASWAAVQVDEALKAITTDGYHASDFQD